MDEPIPSDRGREIPRASTKQLALGAIVILCFSLFVFSNTNGDIGIHGDDVLFMAHIHPFGWDYFNQAAGRGYLTPFYSLVFDLCGQSSQRAHIFWFCVLVFSALVFYRVLSDLLGSAAATMAALFYLAYTGKDEIVTWLSAGAYLVISTVLFVSVWIALQRRLGPWTKAVTITVITWLGTLLCELLIVVAPLYPLLYWLHHRLHGLRTPPRKLIPTFLPSFMFGLHVLNIYVMTQRGNQPIWVRGSTELSFAQMVGNAFQIATTTSTGFRHGAFLARELLVFWNAVPVAAWAIMVIGAAIAGTLVLVVRAPARGPGRPELALLAATGAYLVLLSPLVGFMMVDVVIPARLLTLSGIGLSLIVGVVASIALDFRQPTLRWTVLSLLLAVTCAEAASMNTILYQHQTSWAYDSGIRNQLLASGIQPRPGDGIFLSLPQHPLAPIWPAGFELFAGGHAAVLLTMDYGLLSGPSSVPFEQRLRYRAHVRGNVREGPTPAVPPGNRAYCFVVRDGDYKLQSASCDIPDQPLPSAR